jgi:aromatic ring hydroxylase
MTIPLSGDDLRARIPMQHGADIVALVTYQSVMTLTTTAARIGDAHPKYAERIHRYVERAQRDDIRITECITDAKGDRSQPPSKQDDPDLYTRVVDRASDGVVIRGAKLHITGASLGHELMVIPTKAMKPGEEAYAIACGVPVNAKGVKVVNTTFAPRHEDLRSFDIAGGSVLTAPAMSDLDNPETGSLVRKYMRTMRGVDGEYRLRLFHAIRDVTADAFGGWRMVTNVQAGGGLYAQRIVTRRHYDLQGAKKKALQVAGLLPEDAHQPRSDS